MLIFFIILSIILFIIYKKNIIKNKYLKLLNKYLFLSLIIASILELTIFNYRHYESLFFNKSQEITDYTYVDEITCTKEKCNVDDNTSYIEINNLDTKVDNIELNLKSDDILITNFKISFTDESNKNYLIAGDRTYVNKVTKSHYIRLHPSGKVGNLRFQVTSTNNKFTIDSLKINSRVPLIINNLRLFTILIISLLIFIFNPFNQLHELKYNFKKSRLITIIVIGFIAAIFSALTVFNLKTYTVKPDSHYHQYNILAKALLNGHFYLDLPVSENLTNLENPYDTAERDSKVERYSEYFWDFAFYKGKYYTYFGIVPCLLVYLPYQLVTHKFLANNIAMDIFIFIFVISCFYLVYQIVNKYFKKTSYIWYILLSIFFTFASGLISFSSYPTFYNMPTVAGVSFSCLGLAFWLKSTNKEKLDSKYLFLGSLFMALVAGCRPQLLLSSFFAIIIFWDYVFKKRELFSKKSIKQTILFMIPYLIIASLLCYYNYARFGSIFDFGANYNLTTNDMTRRGFKLDRIFLGLYYFLFAPAKITPVFPFIEASRIATTYLGKTIFENNYGGFLFINLISILGLLSFKFKKILEDKKLFKISVVSIIFALIIIIADTEMAGILPRYNYDFAWLINLSTIIVILALLNKNLLNKDFKKLLVIFIFISLIYNFQLFFLETTVFAENIKLRAIFYYIYYTYMFWI